MSISTWIMWQYELFLMLYNQTFIFLDIHLRHTIPIVNKNCFNQMNCWYLLVTNGYNRSTEAGPSTCTWPYYWPLTTNYVTLAFTTSDIIMTWLRYNAAANTASCYTMMWHVGYCLVVVGDITTVLQNNV